MINKGYVTSLDSLVLMPLSEYRQVRSKLLFADTLINNLQREIDIVDTKIEYYQVKIDALKGFNQILASQNKELREVNVEIMGKYEEAVKTKWFKSPLLYGVSGLVLGFLLFN